MPQAFRYLRFRILAAPLALLILIVALFAGYRAVLIRSDREALRTETAISTRQTAIRLEDAIGTRLQLAVHLRDHEVRDPDWSEGHFREIARGILASFPGIDAINWVDPDGIIRWVVPERPNRAAKGRDLTNNEIAAPVLASARSGRAIAVTPPLELYQGGLGFVAYVAARRDDRVIGFINVAFRTAPLIETWLARGILETHELVLSDGPWELYRSTADGGPGFVYRFEQDLTVGDRAWRVVLWPRAQVVHAKTGSRHDVLLVLGVAFGSAFAFSLFWLTRNRVRLADSEERYRNIVEDSPALVCRFLPDATITFVNDAFASALDLDPAGLVGTSFLDLVPDGDRARLRERLASLGAGSPVVRQEHRMVRSDGSEIWVSWAERSLSSVSGAVVEIQAIGLDTTENVHAREALRRSEARFRTIVNSVTEGILVLAPTGPSTTSTTGRASCSIASTRRWSAPRSGPSTGPAPRACSWRSGTFARSEARSSRSRGMSAASAGAGTRRSNCGRSTSIAGSAWSRSSATSPTASAWRSNSSRARRWRRWGRWRPASLTTSTTS